MEFAGERRICRIGVVDNPERVLLHDRDDVNPVAIKADGARGFVVADRDCAEAFWRCGVGDVEVLEPGILGPATRGGLLGDGGDDAHHAALFVHLEFVGDVPFHRHRAAAHQRAVRVGGIHEVNVRGVAAGVVVVIGPRDHEALVARLHRAHPRAVAIGKGDGVSLNRRRRVREVVAGDFEVRFPAPLVGGWSGHVAGHDERGADEPAVRDRAVERHARNNRRFAAADVADDEFSALVCLVECRRAARPAEFLRRALEDCDVFGVELVKVLASRGHVQRAEERGFRNVGDVDVLQPAVVIEKVKPVAVHLPDIALGHRPRGCGAFAFHGGIEISCSSGPEDSHAAAEVHVWAGHGYHFLAEEVCRACIESGGEFSFLLPEDAEHVPRHAAAEGESDHVFRVIHRRLRERHPRRGAAARLALERDALHTVRHANADGASADFGDLGLGDRLQAVPQVAIGECRHGEHRGERKRENHSGREFGSHGDAVISTLRNRARNARSWSFLCRVAPAAIDTIGAPCILRAMFAAPQPVSFAVCHS